LLNQILNNLDIPTYPQVLAGTSNAEDAGVYKISENLALVQSVDYFTPVVDDPYIFGKITACNSLSDIYAMGATPITAMNILEFPVKELSPEFIENILKGAIEVLKEASTAMIGGHSVDGKELKYGLSVTGIIAPERIFTNDKALLGDSIVLTKKIGTGAIATAIKADLASQESIDIAIKEMTTLNKRTSEICKKFNVHTITDITGFGLIGHLNEVLTASCKNCEIFINRIPFIEQSKEYIDMGLIPEGTYNNINYFSCKVNYLLEIEDTLKYLLFDPQTSGGFLIFAEKEEAENIVKELNKENISANIIGFLTENGNGKIFVK
jgi:selenide,water dikinase